MGPGFFVIAILGCADGGTACTPVATLPARYESSAMQCGDSAALEAIAISTSRRCVAQCRSGSAATAASVDRPLTSRCQPSAPQLTGQVRNRARRCDGFSWHEQPTKPSRPSQTAAGAAKAGEKPREPPHKIRSGDHRGLSSATGLGIAAKE